MSTHQYSKGTVRPDEVIDFLDNVLESSTEYSIIANDLDGRIILWNEGARRIYGYQPEEIVGKEFSSLLHIPEDVKAGQPQRLLDAALRDGKWEGWVERVRKNGERFTARVVITPRFNSAGKPIGFLLISKDISREMELIAANEVLGRAMQAKDRYLAAMSHELRTPLNAIIGFTGTLLMKLAGPLTVDQENQLQIVRSSARHLLSLINDLLDLARIESGKVVLNLEPLVCQSVVEEVAKSLRPMAETKGLSFEVKMPEQDLILKTDRRALSQILINLINNAIKFTEKGFVRLELKRGAGVGRVELSVTDSGKGIKDEDQQKLFQIFEQVHDSKSHIEGTGLGLHLSQKLALLLGGKIICQSKPGSGSRFSLVL